MLTPAVVMVFEILPAGEEQLVRALQSRRVDAPTQDEPVMIALRSPETSVRDGESGRRRRDVAAAPPAGSSVRAAGVQH
jgi:hypothetical protein